MAQTGEDNQSYIRRHRIPQLYNALAVHLLRKRPDSPEGVQRAVQAWFAALEASGSFPAADPPPSPPRLDGMGGGGDRGYGGEEEDTPAGHKAVEAEMGNFEFGETKMVEEVGEDDEAASPGADGEEEDEDEDPKDTAPIARPSHAAAKPEVAFAALTPEPGMRRSDTGTLGRDFFRRKSVAGDLMAEEPLEDEEEERRRELWSVLYDVWDLDGNRYVDFFELEHVLLEIPEIKTDKHERKLIIRTEAELKTRGRGNQLDRADFEELMVNLTRSFTGDKFESFHANVTKAIDEIAKVTQGTQRKRVVWTLFREWDTAQNGWIDFDELHGILSEIPEYSSSRLMKKQTMKWKNRIKSENSEQEKMELAQELAVDDGPAEMLGGGGNMMSGISAMMTRSMVVEEDDKGAKPTTKVSLSQFHGFVNDMLQGKTDQEFYEMIDAMHHHLAEFRRSKLMHKIENEEPEESERMQQFFRRGSVQAFAPPSFEADRKRERRQQWRRLFPLWDLDGNGSIDMFELQQVLLQFDEMEESERALLIKLQDTLNESTGKKSLELDEFSELMVQLTGRLQGGQFDTFYHNVEEVLNEMAKLTHGTGKKRALWHLFHAWDFDGNGYIEFEELEAVLGEVEGIDKTNSRLTRRQSLLWKNKMHQLTHDARASHARAAGNEDENRFSLADFQNFMQKALPFDDETFYKALDDMHDRLLAIRRAQKNEF